MRDDASFDYQPQNGVAHAVAKADGQTAYRSVSARWSGARRQQQQPGAFAPERLGNSVKPYVNGTDYFRDVHAALKGAKKNIFITGWQINWDVELVPGVRLLDALKAALDASPALRIFVMPWMSPKVGVNTGDLGTMLAVFQLNAGRPGSPALCCPAGLQNDYQGVEETFFSHHQKLVVVDNEIAFVGGLDLAYGRRDDGKYSLAHDGRNGCEVYNTGVPPQGLVLPEHQANFISEADLLKVSLTAGLLNGVVQAQDGVQRAADRSVIGRLRGRAIEWWNSAGVEIPAFLREPIEGFNQELQLRWANMQDRAAARLIDKIDAGLLSESDLTSAIAAIGEFMKSTYLALLAVNWLQQQPHAQLFKPQMHAPPASGKLYRVDQPRMPWQDVHCRVQGPSVYDLAMNFIRRWNSLQRSYLPGPLVSRVSIPVALVPQDPGTGQQGGVSVRVLRSAALALQQQEKAAMPSLPSPVRRQDEIHDMMCAVIDKAERFIYIENQFFQSGFGTPSIRPDDADKLSGPMRYMLAHAGTRIKAAMTRVSADNAHTPPRNLIAERIAGRIEHAIRWNQSFHVYMVLPVHPEGSLADIAIVGQIHWTMQSLIHASDSLINRIRVAMAAKQLCKESRNDAQWAQATRAAREIDERTRRPRYRSLVPHPGATRAYLTLLNLRTWESLDGRARTEQVYVHSKLLIADDRLAIIGSANINDRSLRGDRDSELAVCLMDTATTEAPLDGRHAVAVRKAVHELRVGLWRKHFGQHAKGNAVGAADDLLKMVLKPADPATWAAIQRVADANLSAYATAFPFVPQDQRSIWPVWPQQQANQTVSEVRRVGPGFEARMPFSDTFWNDGAGAGRAPSGVKGFVCSLPLLWTEGENNHPGMNMALLTQVPNPDSDTRDAMLASSTTSRHPDGAPV